MKFKITTILLISSVFTCNLAYGQSRSKQVVYAGLHAGSYNFGEGWNGYFGGVMFSYHNQSKYARPEFFRNWGIIGSGIYLSSPQSDVSLTVHFSKGKWLDETSLLQYALGPSLSNFNGLGISGMVLVSHFFSVIESETNLGSIFLQGDLYVNREGGGPKWRFILGISLGVGARN